MAIDLPSTPALTLSLAVLVCGYLTVKCITPPNRTSKGWKNDYLSIYGNDAVIWICCAAVSGLFIYHIALIAAPEPVLELICPNPSHVNPKLFSWNWYTSTCLALVVIGAPLRLGAFNNLGKNFTFGLSQPDKLITTGIYRYLQHPSYTGLMIVAAGSLTMALRWDGSPGCVLPEHMFEKLQGWGSTLFVLAAFSIFQQVVVRTRQEEAMLKEVFGAEWEQWNKKTKRFLPGVY